MRAALGPGVVQDAGCGAAQVVGRYVARVGEVGTLLDVLAEGKEEHLWASVWLGPGDRIGVPK